MKKRNPKKKQKIQYRNYASLLAGTLCKMNYESIAHLSESLKKTWKRNKQVFLCGNGGSAANAMHIANDLFYGIAKKGKGIRAQALPSNISILTCLANDESYENIYSKQLEILGEEGDLLVALSGSGNSPNIINAIVQAKKTGMKTFAILGYSGGKCLSLVDHPIHFPVNDMQISEDLQLIVGHMLMQQLRNSTVHVDKDQMKQRKRK